jgi:hypothetical protein
MANEIDRKKRGDLTPNDEAGFFEHYGNEATARSITGTLLRFSKGDYLAGTEGVVVPAGTRLVAVMDSLLIGWVRWWDNTATEPRMGLIVKGFQPDRRSDLGDDDKDRWEVDNDGEPRDPWRFTNYLILRALKDGETYTFATSSKGGLGCIGELSRAYGKAMRQRSNEWPVIEIDVGSYQHRDRSLGRIKFPIFKIVDWVSKDGPDGAPEDAKPPEPQKPAAAAEPARKTEPVF